MIIRLIYGVKIQNRYRIKFKIQKRQIRIHKIRFIDLSYKVSDLKLYLRIYKETHYKVGF